MFQALKQSTRFVLSILVFSMVLTCEDNRDIYSSVKIQIVMTSGTDTNSGQNNRITGSLSSDVTNITITISGVEPVNVNVTSGATVTQTIDGVPLGEQTAKIDLKDAGGIILYTQTQTVIVEAGKTASPTFPADDFTAENVEIELTSPNGDEAWELGTTQSITWTTSHPSENVAITLYQNSALNQVLSAATASTGSYSWTIADTIAEGSSYTIRIALVSDPGTFDDSDNTFTLTSTSQPTITVTSPNGGENWEMGSTHDITWTSSDVSGNVYIFLYKSGSVEETLSADESNDGSYSWTIPDSYDEGSNYKVKVSSVSDGSVYDESDSNFTLTSTSQPTITVTSPNGGEDWELGSEHNISWTSSSVVATSIPANRKNARTKTNFLQKTKTLNEKENILKSKNINLERALNRTQSENSRGNVKIELYKDGSAYQTIVESTDDDGSYSWTIPDSYDEGSNYKVRIFSVSNASVYDESDADFTLTTATGYNGPTWYVSTTGSDSNNGNEDNPFATIQYGLNVSSYGDTIIVASGTYGENLIWPSINGITLIGSGEENCIIDGGQQKNVIKIEGAMITDQTLITGFTISNGYAADGDYTDWPSSDNGGGICIINASPRLVNLIISDNEAKENGGGIYCTGDYNAGDRIISSPSLENVLITNNTSTSVGGGIMIANYAKCNLMNVIISDNNALSGGGLWNQLNNAGIAMSNVIIKDNVATYNGGGAYLRGSWSGSSNTIYSETLSNVLISGNQANGVGPSAGQGGGLLIEGGAEPIFSNVTITENSAGYRGGGICIGLDQNDYSIAELVNSVIWNNTPESIFNYHSSSFSNFSDIEGLSDIVTHWSGEGNIDADPLFCDPENGDFSLNENSPCVGTGLDGANMGAFDVGCYINPTITVTNPNGGEVWEVVSTHDITWNTNFMSGNIKIELFKDGSAYQIIEGNTENNGSYSWTIPSTYDADNDYRVRISSVEDANVYDESDNDFSISLPPYTITSPNGGEDWELGSTHDVTWTSGDVSGNVKIELYQGGNAYQIIEGSTDDDGTHSWTIPSSYDEGSDYKVRISSVSDGTVYDESDANFTLTAADQQTTWTNTFGGVFDEEGNSVQQTSDGGYILTGYTKSYGNTYGDVWLIKTDSQGSEEWNQTFGGGSSSKGYSVRQTSDGGYIIAGYINPTYGNTYTDIWLIKTDSQGNEEWNQTYGGNSYDYGYSVEETSDGGYIIIGDSEMSGSPIFLIKTDSQGNEEWEQTFNETNYSQFGRSVKQTSDGGYIITGYSRAGGVASDVLLIKADSEGNEEWKQTFGGNSADYGYSVEETSDGGYIITGETESYGSSKDVWLIKTDSQGNEVWNQTFGGSDDDSGHSVEQTLDGGYIITGYTDSFGNGYYHDVWLIKTDSGGQEEWNQTYGGSFSDEGRSVQQTLDGGYIITGYTRPAGATYDDVWLIKTDSQGNISE
ncbi:GPI anchored serine-threonine rich family protein [Candidatus Marinimicrobia bacterium]|nr:GPI anchored serine-threonine rich family protein [Candidatus Neomarinimicrobiota bacterium]